MTDTLTPRLVSPAPPSAPPAGGVRHLLRHLAEMALAMVAGMLLLAPLWRIAGAPLGLTAVLARPDVAALVMATNMTVGMTVWMRHRRHSRAACAEMAAAMYVPFLLLLVPYRAGWLAADTLMLGGHLLMVPAMVLVAVRHRHDPVGPAPRRHPLVAAVRHRWPAGLALLMTADNWVSPSVLSPWTLLVLPAGYLVIGAYRRRLGGPGVLARQLVGLAGWSGLALVAVLVGGQVAAWLVAVGWLAHAVWDVVHYRRDEVVPRGYAQWCAVLDAVLGVTIVLAVLSA
ncbi:hypothetical protein ACFOOK_14875 [Micromonospora krabiensis]|uniref:Uncharacterized protein n=1 Tax=Micromonospora krabiensis TaxID=307121 RepID=A0A1C3N124_9ACTN|nr:hypothetical protein [Micromonospora krabiensis]SBV26279.1 hypothetical protein GA0070620_1766 [Micromonospora krabiensis]